MTEFSLLVLEEGADGDFHASALDEILVAARSDDVPWPIEAK